MNELGLLSIPEEDKQQFKKLITVYFVEGKSTEEIKSLVQKRWIDWSFTEDYVWPETDLDSVLKSYISEDDLKTISYEKKIEFINSICNWKKDEKSPKYITSSIMAKVEKNKKEEEDARRRAATTASVLALSSMSSSASLPELSKLKEQPVVQRRASFPSALLLPSALPFSDLTPSSRNGESLMSPSIASSSRARSASASSPLLSSSRMRASSASSSYDSSSSPSSPRSYSRSFSSSQTPRIAEEEEKEIIIARAEIKTAIDAAQITQKDEVAINEWLAMLANNKFNVPRIHLATFQDPENKNETIEGNAMAIYLDDTKTVAYILWITGRDFIYAWDIDFIPVMEEEAVTRLKKNLQEEQSELLEYIKENRSKQEQEEQASEQQEEECVLPERTYQVFDRYQYYLTPVIVSDGKPVLSVTLKNVDNSLAKSCKKLLSQKDLMIISADQKNVIDDAPNNFRIVQKAKTLGKIQSVKNFYEVRTRFPGGRQFRIYVFIEGRILVFIDAKFASNKDAQERDIKHIDDQILKTKEFKKFVEYLQEQFNQ